VGEGKTAVLPVPLTAPGPSIPSNVGLPVAPAATAPTSRRRTTTRHASIPPPIKEEQVEPAQGRLQLNSDAWVIAAPTRSSKVVRRVHSRKYVQVTGLAADYVRVQLHDGTIGYIPVEAVDLVSPVAKLFRVVHNSPVFEKASMYSGRVAEVHTPGEVVVIGVAPKYLKVRMRSGVEGFVPATAFE